MSQSGPDNHVEGFVPSYLLERLRQCDDAQACAWADNTLALDAQLRSSRANPTALPVLSSGPWEIYDAKNGTELPGTLARASTDPATDDVSVNEAADGIAASLALFADSFGRNSFDGNGATVVGTVHYGENYDNAFWDGTQLVFGDGDGKVFNRFTKSIDILAHELTHAVTEKTANLTYQGQSGALNESISDVFGSCVKQRSLGQTAEAADWLIGEGIFASGVNGKALRSMKEPGTAYDDPQLGKDPQVGHMDDYLNTTDDNGGVHLNSGIPNRAFYLAATSIGGDTTDGAGKIWFAALTSGIGPDTDFAGFAAATVAAAGEHADAVSQAWQAVGVVATPGSSSTPAPAPSGASTPLRVRRSGGLTGIERTGEIDLAADDARARNVAQLWARVDQTALAASAPSGADRFVYHFDAPGQPTLHVNEQDLSGDLRSVASAVLDADN